MAKNEIFINYYKSATYKSDFNPKSHQKSALARRQLKELNRNQFMKRFFTVALLSLALCSSKLLALTLTLQGGAGYGPYQTGVGGEFTFGISDSSLVGSYSSYTRNQAGPGTSFQSFCVEGAENIYAYQSYTAQYNNRTMYTDVALSRGAAYLYSQFAQGTLSGYNFSGTTAQRQASANLLQRAIWMLMGGQEGLNAGNIGANIFIDAVKTVFGSLAGANATAATGEYNVYVLNLWDVNGRAAQDQLIYTTTVIPNTIAPDGGITVILLGMGLTAVGFVSRKVRSKS